MPLPKLFPLILVLTLFLSPVVSKAELLPLSATVNGTIITATLTGISPANIEKVDIFIQTDPFPTTALCPSVSAPCSATQPTKEVIGTTIKWTVKTGLTGGTTYNLRAEGKNGYVFLSNVVTVKTGSETIDALWPLTSTSDGNNAWIKGKLNNPSPKDFTAKLEYSVTNLKTDGSPVPNVKEAKALKTNTNNAVFGINDDGTYYYRLIDLTPGQQYSIRETIVSKNDARQIKVGSFNTKDGIILENSESAVKSDAQRSYSLLAPLPGLSVVLDNDLCREYVTAGKPVPGGSCDNQIGYFINLLIRMLIGLSVVILVVKIIFEGYQYMVTDIPFIKASAKSKLFESFFGLMLALASYLILNTINPRLVNGGVSIDTIAIELDEESDTNDLETFSGPTGATITASTCVGGVVAIPTGIAIKSSVDNKTVCKNFAPKLTELKSKTPTISWRITSTTNGKHASQCHKKGTAKTGNCLDIALTSGGNPLPADDPRWGTLCQAINSISGLSFLNEASKTPGCQNIRKNVQTKYGSGSHLHVIYTGN